jgi:hypothetical protein
MSVFQNGKSKGPDTRYLVLDSVLGEVAIFQTQKFFLESKTDKADFVKLSQVLCCMHGFKEEMAKKKLHAIELSFVNEKLQLLFGAFDQD